MLAEKILIVVALLSFLAHRKLKSLGSPWHDTVAMVSWGLVSILVVRLFFWEPFRTEGPSMEPTIPSHSIVILDRRAYGFPIPWVQTQNWFSHARPNDIVAFHQGGETLVKRVRASFGDNVEMRYPSGWFVNGVFVAPLSRHPEEWLRHAGFPSAPPPGSTENILDQYRVKQSFKVTVPYGYIFVAGDNPFHSMDSRDFGFVPMYKVMGKIERLPVLLSKDIKDSHE